MLAQECPIMHPTKNKSETKFGQHALTIRYYSTAIYIYIYIYNIYCSRLCCHYDIIPQYQISLLLNHSLKVSSDLLLRSTFLIKSMVSDSIANLSDPTANSLTTQQ